MSKQAQHWEKNQRFAIYYFSNMVSFFSIGIFFFSEPKWKHQVFRPLGYPLSYYMDVSGFSWNFCNTNFFGLQIDKKKLMKNLVSLKERMIK